MPQPLACAACGPSLRWREAGLAISGDAPSLAAALAALRAGAIIAVRASVVTTCAVMPPTMQPSLAAHAQESTDEAARHHGPLARR